MFLRYIAVWASLALILGDAAAQDGTVHRVLDGDTIQLDNGRVVHLIGLDAPPYGEACACPLVEEAGVGSSSRALGEQATAHTRTWSYGQLVKLEWEATDLSLERADTIWAYAVILNPDSSRAFVLNEALVSDGMALACLDGRHRTLTRYALLQKRARSRRLGFWNKSRAAHFDGAGTHEACGCEDFTSLRRALRFFKAEGGPEIDPHVMDIDQDGIPCEARFRRDRRAVH